MILDHIRTRFLGATYTRVYTVIQHAVQQSNNNTDSANTLTTTSYNTSTVFTLINFYDQRVFTPRNNNRRNIRVDGSSICLNQLSVHFRNMSRNSRGRVYCPWCSTRLRLTSKANRWLHASLVLPATLKTLRSKRLCQTFKCLELLRAQLNATVPGQNSGPTWLLVGRYSSDFV